MAVNESPPSSKKLSWILIFLDDNVFNQIFCSWVSSKLRGETSLSDSSNLLTLGSDA